MTLLQDMRRQLKLYRAEHTLSQAEVGEMIGLDQGSISAFERGDANLGAQKIERLMELMGLRLIQGAPPPSPTQAPSLVHEAAAPYGPSREVPIPSPEQIEFALDAARSLGDEEILKALQEMQMQILGIIAELRGIGDGYSRYLKDLEQRKYESQHRPKDAVG